VKPRSSVVVLPSPSSALQLMTDAKVLLHLVLYHDIIADCGQENKIRAKDPIQCRGCGYRIMYKQRTKRLIQFEAR
jgi:DNA-directed RNA polymerases I, II, and III subunit RPABC4